MATIDFATFLGFIDHVLDGDADGARAIGAAGHIIVNRVGKANGCGGGEEVGIVRRRSVFQLIVDDRDGALASRRLGDANDGRGGSDRLEVVGQSIDSQRGGRVRVRFARARRHDRL